MTPPPASGAAMEAAALLSPRRPSLAEVNGTIDVPSGKGASGASSAASPARAILVAVGYMDPGNWATDLARGSAFGNTLLSVILLSNLMAMVLQSLAAKLGICTGRDLARACRDFSSPALADRSVAAMRARDRRLRSCRTDRHRDRAPAPFRHSAYLGHLPHRIRRDADPLSPAARPSAVGGVHSRAPDHHRGMLRRELALARRPSARSSAASSRPPRSSATPPCSTSRWGSSARR